MKSSFFVLVLFFASQFCFELQAQKWIITRGQAVFHAATQSTNAYSDLTTGSSFSYGSLFLNNTINLNNPFDYSFKLNFGDRDADGADGMVFVIHNDPRGADALGCVGMGLGFSSSTYTNDWLPESSPIMNSIAIEFDTYKNSEKGDPAEDHLAYVENGDNNHNDFSGTYLKKLSNIEDGQFHTFRITWNPANNNLRVYFDDVLKLSLYKSLRSIIGNTAYIGFTSTTGESANKHIVEDINSPLPVKLISFSGEYNKEQNAVELNWATATELNNSHFVVERSYEGKSFEAIGILAGSGNSNSTLKYTFSDPVARKVSCYYRLVQFDFDGKTESFAPIFVKIVDQDQEPRVSIMSEGKVRISDATGGEIKIYSLDGRLLINENVTDPDQIVDFRLPTGIVIVDIVNGESHWSQKIFVKD